MEHEVKLIKKIFFGSKDVKEINKDTKLSMEKIAIYSKKNGISKVYSAAKLGNLDCQVFLSQTLLFQINKFENDRSFDHSLLENMKTNFEKYTEMAAEQGDSTSQFNLGKYYFSKVDILKKTLNEEDILNFMKTKYWYEKAQSNGWKDLEEILSTINEILVD